MAREQLYDEMGSQMELAGLVADPNEVDPVSGNEIPVGATAEGVRDDEVANISPGEFVIPDYAVRYHGIDFYVASLEQAKQGLRDLEEKGLVGEPEDETIPDPAMAEQLMEMAQQDTGEMSDSGQPMTAQLHAGGTLPSHAHPHEDQGDLFEVPITAPIAAPTAVQPLDVTPPSRPAILQPVPRAPTFPDLQQSQQGYLQPANPALAQFQQGYYVPTGGGFYTRVGPPGTMTTQQAFTLEQLPPNASIAPKGTQAIDVWGGQQGSDFSKYIDPRTPYQQFSGQTIKEFINEETRRRIWLPVLYGGEVVGGLPPGFRLVTDEDDLVDEDEMQEPSVTPEITGQRQAAPGSAGGYKGPLNQRSPEQTAISLTKADSTPADVSKTMEYVNAEINKRNAASPDKQAPITENTVYNELLKQMKWEKSKAAEFINTVSKYSLTAMALNKFKEAVDSVFGSGATTQQLLGVFEKAIFSKRPPLGPPILSRKGLSERGEKQRQLLKIDKMPSFAPDRDVDLAALGFEDFDQPKFETRTALAPASDSVDYDALGFEDFADIETTPEQLQLIPRTIKEPKIGPSSSFKAESAWRSRKSLGGLITKPKKKSKLNGSKGLASR